MALAWRRCSRVMVNTAWLRLLWRFIPVAAVARIREPCSKMCASSCLLPTCRKTPAAFRH